MQWISRGANKTTDGVPKFARNQVYDLGLLASLPSMILDVFNY